MPTCPKCKAEQPENAQFCSQCSEPLTEHGKKFARSKISTVVAAVFVTLGFAALVIVLYNLASTWRNSRKNSTAVSVTPQTPVVPQQPYSVPIANNATTVKASGFTVYTFTVPLNANTVAVNGRFSAKGGKGNDIVCYVLDQDAFTNFKNGHPPSTYYNSGKVSTAVIRAVLLTPGTYYLVLDNRFSLVTPKAVQIDAMLSYMK